MFYFLCVNTVAGVYVFIRSNIESHIASKLTTYINHIAICGLTRRVIMYIKLLTRKSLSSLSFLPFISNSIIKKNEIGWILSEMFSFMFDDIGRAIEYQPSH